MSPFWPPKMDRGLIDARAEQFEKSIYPLWAPFFLGGKAESEIDAMHKADTAICDSGIKMDRSDWVDPEKRERRDAARQGYDKVYGD